MRVIKLHSIKIRVKADTKCQPRNLRGKTCREREKNKVKVSKKAKAKYKRLRWLSPGTWLLVIPL